MSKEYKVFKCTITVPLYLHLRAHTKEQAFKMAMLYFEDKQEATFPSCEEVDEDTVDPEIIFDAGILPTYHVH